MNGDADDTPPEIELIRPHGSGLYGVVWEGMQARLNRKVAVRFIKAGRSHWSNVLEHAQVLARVNHPNVVTIYQITQMPHPDTGQITDCSVMEWLEGKTLSIHLKGDRFAITEAAEIARGILDGLEAIHAQGIAHTDLHDENIILAPKVKIIDIDYEASKSLAVLSSTSRGTRLIGDIEAAGVLLGDVLRHSTATHEGLSETLRQVRHGTSIGELRGLIDNYLNNEDEFLTASGFQTSTTSAITSGLAISLGGSFLSDKAIQTLFEASQDKNGSIVFSSTMHGKFVRTNEKNLVKTDNPRIIAEWKAAIAELSRHGLIELNSSKGGSEFYNVTNPGYKLADRMRNGLQKHG